MSRAVDGLLNKAGSGFEQFDSSKIKILIDGKNIIPQLKYQQEAIVKGDSVVHSIAASSIIAKVYRDQLMCELHERYPNYGLEHHKGYGTKFHINAIRTYGLTPIHRASFCGNIV